MEDMIIPGSVVVLLSSVGTLVLGWLVFLTIRLFENKQAIAVASEQTRQIYVELQRLYTSLESVKTDIRDLRAEINEFKSEVTSMLKTGFSHETKPT